MKSMVKTFVALSVMAFASVSFASPKCNHQSDSGMFAKTNPETKSVKTLSKVVKGQETSSAGTR